MAFPLAHMAGIMTGISTGKRLSIGAWGGV